jgi:hypothetical protein
MAIQLPGQFLVILLPVIAGPNYSLPKHQMLLFKLFLSMEKLFKTINKGIIF